MIIYDDEQQAKDCNLIGALRYLLLESEDPDKKILARCRELVREHKEDGGERNK